MDMHELQQHLDRHIQEQNNTGRPEFGGYSPVEMHHILHHTFEPQSPLSLRKLSDPDLQKIPILNLTRYLAGILDHAGELKLTAKGFLPTKIVADMYGQGFIKDEIIEKYNTKLYKETDSPSVHLSRILLEITGLAKKRTGKLSLTKVGKKLLKDPNGFLTTLVQTYIEKFNWAYMDGFGDTPIGKLGCGFSLILLAQYGEKERPAEFYAHHYLRAFPRIVDTVQLAYRSKEEEATSCYILRNFKYFMTYFGLIHFRTEGGFLDEQRFVTKSDLLDKWIQISPHQGL
jgi:hypothetical protein